jgi:hypothetical protein
MEIALNDQPLKISTDLNLWLSSIKTKIGMRILSNLNTNTDELDRYIECAELQELPGTFVCCSFFQKDINLALTRAGLFLGAGKGMSAGTLAKQDSPALLNYQKLVAGHNLAGPVILDFFRATDAATDAQLKSNSAEAALSKALLQWSRLTGYADKFYVIGFSIQTTKDQRGVVSHEIFHAYYFLNLQYKATVVKFWRDHVSAEDRTAITLEIGRAYNTESEDLVIDEFQAYLVQENAENDRMKAFVGKYRQDLLRALQAQGIDWLRLS